MCSAAGRREPIARATKAPIAWPQADLASVARRFNWRLWPSRLRDRRSVRYRVRRRSACDARLAAGHSAFAPPRAGRVPKKDISFPLARRIGAIWVGRADSQWIAHYTRLVKLAYLRSPRRG